MKYIFTLSVSFFLLTIAKAQRTIYDIMEMNHLRFQDVEALATNYFDSVGRGQGSGFKQYERWRYERKFHLDENGYYITPATEEQRYNATVNAMPTARTMGSYTELGPWSWTYTSGWNPGVGRITAVAVYPADTTILYASSPGGGIWKSMNSGTTWQPLVDGTSSYMNVYNLAVDPTNANIVYAGLTSGGVIKSTNGGTTWAATGSGPSTIKKILINPNNTNLVYVTSNNGLHRSTNGGTTWTNVFNLASREDIEFKPGDDNIMYCSGNGNATISSVYKSIDAGLNWTAVTVTDGITDFGRTLIAVTPAMPSRVYVVQANGSIFGRMYLSNNDATTFSTTIVGNPTANTNFFGYSGNGTTGQATYDMGMCTNPTNADEVYIAGIVVWKSTNAGTSFTQMTVWSYPNGVGYNHADVHGLQWVNNTIYSNSDGGVYKSRDKADNWIDLSVGLGIRQLYRLATAKTNAEVMSAGAQDNGTVARTSTGTWRDWLGADGMECIIDPNNANNFIGTSQYGSIYGSTNGGTSAFNLYGPAAGNWVTPLCWHPTSSTIVYGGWDSIYRSTNTGVNWTCISKGFATGGNLDQLKVAPSDANYIYASRGSNLFVTTNGGTTWTSYGQGGAITSIEVKHNDPNKVWITTSATSNNVLQSINAGATFTAINTGLPALGARSIVVDDTPNETIYVAMNLDVYYKDLVNTNWALLATGLPKVAINEIEITKIAGKLRIATYGRGIWETALVTNASLPLHINSFTAQAQANGNLIQWNVTTTANTNFYLEASTNGINFQRINTQQSNATHQYSFFDVRQNNTTVYYRLAYQEAVQWLYSGIVVVKGKQQKELLTILTNPVAQQLKIAVTNTVLKDYIITLYNGNGQRLFATKVSSAIATIDVANYPNGVYVVEAMIDGNVYTKQFVIKK